MEQRLLGYDTWAAALSFPIALERGLDHVCSHGGCRDRMLLCLLTGTMNEIRRRGSTGGQTRPDHVIVGD